MDTSLVFSITTASTIIHEADPEKYLSSYATFTAILTLLGNLITDVLYAVVDPRVRVAS